ncbi:NAD-dependent epimerase/dehydratase family protein [Kitasatospora sp. NPDC052896]|uniref:NAD-dependent epimerase/dehydratase family protein n=1 Tax=Kitasatospora sp. NPDC052896 TaxID=3364061 RepID=UPI0037C77704
MTAPAAGRSPAGRQVVVLGGSGFLGRHLSAAFRQAGADVLAVSRTAPAQRHLAPGVRALAMDLTSAGPDRLAGLLAEAGADLVVNAAGAVWGVTQGEMRRANAELVGDLVEAMAGLPDQPRLIQLGSVHEYGPGAVGGGTAESHTPAPITPYGQVKLLASDRVLAAARSGALDGVVLRIANITGPGTPPGSLLGGLAERLARLREAADPDPVLELAPLRASRDFVDVRDVVDAVLATAAAAADLVRGQVINIGSGRATPVRHAVERLIAHSKVAARLVERESGTARSDTEWQQLDIAKAGRLLGWQPHHDLDGSLGALADGTRAPIREGRNGHE